MRKKSKGFTLLEVLIVTVIIGALAALVVPRVLEQVYKAQQAEAVQNLGSIRSSELVLQSLAGQFVAAADELGIQTALGLTIGSRFYNYKIIDASSENFLAIATPIEALKNWLDEVAINKDGFVGFTPGVGASSSSGSGGGSSGGGSSGGTGGGGSSGSGSSGSSAVSVGGGGGTTVITTPVVSYETITTTPTLDTSFAAPTQLQLTPNDGWLVINYLGNSNADGYQIYRRENAEILPGHVPVYTSLTPTTVWGSFEWSDEVSNGVSYCYVVKSLKQDVNGNWSESASSDEVCGEAAPNADYEAKSSAALTTLTEESQSFSALLEPPVLSSDPSRTPDTWDDIVANLAANDIPILFGKMHDIVSGSQTSTILGEYNPVTHAIVINDKYATAPKEMIASIIAHEGLHAMWDQDWDTGGKILGNPPADWVIPSGFVAPRSINSRKQEYNSFVGGFQVWEELQSQVTDPMDANAAALSSSWATTQDVFLDDAGNPVSFTSASVTQFFSSMTVYSELLDY